MVVGSKPSRRMTQPASLRKSKYRYGIETVNGPRAWRLFKAAADGDCETAQRLLDREPNLVNAQLWYQFPIHLAVYQGHATMVKLLLASGADPGQSRFTYDSWDKLLSVAQQRGFGKVAKALRRAMRARFGYSSKFEPLRLAFVERDSRQIRKILKKQPQLLVAADALGNTPLHWSVITRQLPLIEHLAQRGASLDALRADGQSPLLLAINSASDYWYRGTRSRTHRSIRNAWVMVGQLLAHGAEYSLSVAAAVGDLEQVKKILKRDPDAANRLDTGRVSPLSHAAREGYTHIVEALLHAGAEPNRAEELAPDGRALFEACGGNHLETAKLLLEHGANPQAGVDSCGCCFTIATHHFGDAAKPLIAELKKAGATQPPYAMNLTQLRRAIRTGGEILQDEEFLHAVFSAKNESLLRAYLSVASPFAQTPHVYSGIDYPQSPKLVRLLLAEGAMPNRPDWQGKTFLHACAEQGDIKCAQEFLEAGADVNAIDLRYQGTPLAAAVRNMPEGEADPMRYKLQLKMVEFLLQQGAAVDLPSDQQWATPLAWARTREQPEVAKLLQLALAEQSENGVS